MDDLLFNHRVECQQDGTGNWLPVVQILQSERVVTGYRFRAAGSNDFIEVDHDAPCRVYPPPNMEDEEAEFYRHSQMPPEAFARVSGVALAEVLLDNGDTDGAYREIRQMYDEINDLRGLCQRAADILEMECSDEDDEFRAFIAALKGEAK